MSTIVITIVFSTLTLLVSLIGAMWRFALAFSKVEASIANVASAVSDVKTRVESIDRDVRDMQTHVAKLDVIVAHDAPTNGARAR